MDDFDITLQKALARRAIPRLHEGFTAQVLSRRDTYIDPVIPFQDQPSLWMVASTLCTGLVLGIILALGNNSLTEAPTPDPTTNMIYHYIYKTEA